MWGGKASPKCARMLLMLSACSQLQGLSKRRKRCRQWFRLLCYSFFPADVSIPGAQTRLSRTRRDLIQVAMKRVLRGKPTCYQGQKEASWRKKPFWGLSLHRHLPSSHLVCWFLYLFIVSDTPLFAALCGHPKAAYIFFQKSNHKTTS